MRDLVRVELTRFRWRRAVLLLLVLAVVLPAIMFVAVVWNTRPVSAEEQQRVEEQVARDAQQPYVQKDLDRCLRKPDQYGLSAQTADLQAQCEDLVLPQVGWYSTRQPLDLEQESSTGTGPVVPIVLAIVLLLVGTTFVGHDWNSGSMSNQLLFEPRRARIWAAKGLVVLLTGLVVAGVVLTAYWTGLWVVATQRDLPIAAGVLGDIAGAAARCAVLAAGAGLGGYALTMLFRSTVATLGALFVLGVVGPLLVTALGVPGTERVLPQTNYVALLRGGVEFPRYDRPGCYDGGRPGAEDPCVVRISTTQSGVYFGVLLLLAGAPSVLSFRRRDIA